MTTKMDRSYMGKYGGGLSGSQWNGTLVKQGDVADASGGKK